MTEYKQTPPNNRTMNVTSQPEDQAIVQSIVLVTVILVFFRRCFCTTSNEVQYSFQYVVDAGGVTTHRWEERRGDLVHGAYSLVEADGRVRIVEYRANDHEGFKAVVRHRNPPEIPRGHLPYPGPNQKPVVFAQPIHLLGEKFIRPSKPHPNVQF